jgi:hypothetical protein
MTTRRVDNAHSVDSVSSNVVKNTLGYGNFSRRDLYWDAQCVHPKESISRPLLEQGQIRSVFGDLYKVCLEHTKLARWQTILERIPQTIGPHMRDSNIFRIPRQLLDFVPSIHSSRLSRD